MKTAGTTKKGTAKTTANRFNRRGLKAVILGPRKTLDAAAAFLIAAGSPGVCEESEFLPPEAAPLESKEAALYGYLERLGEKDKVELRRLLANIGWSIEFKSPDNIERGDWAEKWKRHIKAVRAGIFLVRPTWKKTVKARRGEKVIEIDPGMAFGTGTHPSTAMSLKAIDFIIRKKKLASPENLLDVGTGSGILAIAAAKLGVKRIVGTDIDEEALLVAAENARLNKVRMSFSKKPPDKIPGSFAMVTANIQSNVLKELLPALSKKTRPSGFIILSGILKEEACEVEEAYAKTGGFTMVKRFGSKEWAALLMRKESQGA